MVEEKTAVTINGHCIQWEPAANFQPVFVQNPLEKSWLDIESNNCPVCNVTSNFYLMLTPNFAIPIIWILLLVLLLALLTATVTDNSSVKDAAGTRPPPSVGPHAGLRPGWSGAPSHSAPKLPNLPPWNLLLVSAELVPTLFYRTQGRLLLI